VVAQGELRPDGVFVASQVLAKHDENYMPPEAEEALRKAGHPVRPPERFVDQARESVQK
jgi:cytochrome c-type biogenesis protein CcmE